jgi:hypothetical protein
MYAGDVGAMVPLLRRVKRLLPKTETPAVDDVSAAVVEAYQEELIKVKEQRYLKPNKLDWDKFQKNDPPLFTDTIYEQMKTQLDGATISIDPYQPPILLVAGFDTDGPGHIFSVDHPGVESGHDIVGFHAIGTGSYYALTMLHSHCRDVSHSDPLDRVVYRVAEAKFMAENDAHVGKSTTLIRWENNDNPRFVLEKNIRKLWNRVGRPRIPKGIGDKIKEIVETDSYALELPEQIEIGVSNTVAEVPQGLNEIVQKNSQEVAAFIASIRSG